MQQLLAVPQGALHQKIKVKKEKKEKENEEDEIEEEEEEEEEDEEDDQEEEEEVTKLPPLHMIETPFKQLLESCKAPGAALPCLIPASSASSNLPNSFNYNNNNNNNGGAVKKEPGQKSEEALLPSINQINQYTRFNNNNNNNNANKNNVNIIYTNNPKQFYGGVRVQQMSQQQQSFNDVVFNYPESLKLNPIKTEFLKKNKKDRFENGSNVVFVPVIKKEPKEEETEKEKKITSSSC